MRVSFESLRQDLQTVRNEIKAVSPDYAALTQPKSLDLPDIQTKLLDGDTLLLEYSLGADRSYLWLVGKNSGSELKVMLVIDHGYIFGD